MAYGKVGIISRNVEEAEVSESALVPTQAWLDSNSKRRLWVVNERWR